MIRRIFNRHLRDLMKVILWLTFRVNSPVWTFSSIASICSSSRINFEFVAEIWSRVVLRSVVKELVNVSVFADIEFFVSSNFKFFLKVELRSISGFIGMSSTSLQPQFRNQNVWKFQTFFSKISWFFIFCSKSSNARRKSSISTNSCSCTLIGVGWLGSICVVSFICFICRFIFSNCSSQVSCLFQNVFLKMDLRTVLSKFIRERSRRTTTGQSVRRSLPLLLSCFKNPFHICKFLFQICYWIVYFFLKIPVMMTSLSVGCL